MMHMVDRLETGSPDMSWERAPEGPIGVAAQFADLARELSEIPSLDQTLTAITDTARSNVPGTDCSSITAFEGGEIETVAATDELLREADRLQLECGEGPCLETLTTGRSVFVDDLAGSDRYRDLGPKLAELGLHSVLAYQLFAGDRKLGALNFFAKQPGVFTEEAAQLGWVFANHAAVALASAHKEQQLQVAISTRDLIGQAKGILMERYKIDADTAFALLVRSSQRSHRKLREVAEQLARTGEDLATS
jgi:GAF domain-containing protein